MKKFYLIITLVIFAQVSALSQTTEVVLTANMDNTIFKNLELSNGIGQYTFAGTTRDGVTKRALIQFDLESNIPDDAIVDSASLILHPAKVKPASTLVSVFVLATEWGEGASEAIGGDGKGDVPEEDDATWTFSKFASERWVKSGGDFAFTVSDTATVTFGKDAVFSSSGITEDIKFWLKDPDKNFGWIFIGDEVNTSTSVKFASKDNADENLWPKLKIYYQGATSSSQLEDKRLDLKVYQGASMNNLIISNPGDPGICSMEVFSITGTMLFSDRFPLSTGNNTIETGIHDPGIYVYRIIQNQKTTSGKLLISNK